MNYVETLKALLALIETADQAADAPSHAWLIGEDAGSRGYFGKLAAAVVAIAGEDFWTNWCQSGEPNFELANRNEEGVKMKNAETPIEILKRLKAPLVGVYLGVKFYEDPIHGDEEPLLAVYKGRVVCSGGYGVPEEAVCIDIMNEIDAVILGVK